MYCTEKIIHKSILNQLLCFPLHKPIPKALIPKYMQSQQLSQTHTTQIRQNRYQCKVLSIHHLPFEKKYLNQSQLLK